MWRRICTPVASPNRPCGAHIAATLRLLAGSLSGQTRSRCSARRSQSRLPAGVIGVALSWLAVLSGTVRGEAGKGFVLLEVALPSLLIYRCDGKEDADECDHRNGPAQALGDDRGAR